MASAQKALQEDPGNKGATDLVESALQGQKAESHIKNAEAALAKGDYAAASAEAEKARSAAPWDSQATSLVGRIRDAQQQAQLAGQQKEQQERAAKAQQAQAQATAFLKQATDQLSARQLRRGHCALRRGPEAGSLQRRRHPGPGRRHHPPRPFPRRRRAPPPRARARAS